VTKSTKNVRRVLGYAFEDIYNQNIKIIMPESIAAVHDFILENYVKKSGVTASTRDQA
jgi:hypothetical protein